MIENGRVIKKGSAKELLESTDVVEMYMGGSKNVSFDGVKYYHRRRPCCV
jgi:hypothetical protein